MLNLCVWASAAAMSWYMLFVYNMLPYAGVWVLWCAYAYIILVRTR